MALKRVLRLLSPVPFEIASCLKPTYTGISTANEQLHTYVAQSCVSEQDSEFKGMPASFPCVDRLKEKSSSLTGKKGVYGEDVGGFKLMNYAQPFHFKHGGVLPEMQIAYEEWGTRNKDRSNVVLLFTGLSASSHAKGHDVRIFLATRMCLRTYLISRSPSLDVGQSKSRVVGEFHRAWRTSGYQQVQYHLL